MPDADAVAAEPETGATGDKKIRVHILVYEQDWDWLGVTYGSALKRGNIVRMLLRDFKRRMEAKVEGRL
jgi:hypothetical protein